MSEKNDRLKAALPDIERNARSLTSEFDWRDLVQHACLIYLESDQNPDNVGGWVTSVMKRQLFSKYSTFRRQNDSIIEGEISEHEDYNDLWEHAEIIAAHLPELERKVIFLLSRGVSVPEIAATSKIPQSTIYVLITRAKKIIRENIG